MPKTTRKFSDEARAQMAAAMNERFAGKPVAEASELLVSCPDCGTPNFTARGLVGHRGRNHCKSVQAERAVLAIEAETVAAKPAAKHRQLATLTDLDVLPASPGRIVSLRDMTVPQLSEAFAGLEKAQGEYEQLSGICATLSGLVLQEVKAKVGHGNYKDWLKENYPKSSRTAQLYTQLASAFAKSAPKCAFEQMTLALLDGAQGREGQSLDFSNPLVARVAKWAKGRSFYQLRQEELTPGGNNHPTCPHCGADLGSKTQPICPQCGKETALKEPTPEEIRAELTADTRQWAQEQITDKRAAHKLYRLLPDHEAEALAAHYRGLAKEIDGWVKTPARKREELSLEEALA